ncbi:hypothetical protein ACFY05_31960 [Microtetraspora fusca]|uniref:Uncharacterized protein n=1 Tax=Microtetraspora fusca TaxID=1997 RepID=A0ABW6VDQ8_MICFU
MTNLLGHEAPKPNLGGLGRRRRTGALDNLVGDTTTETPEAPAEVPAATVDAPAVPVEPPAPATLEGQEEPPTESEASPADQAPTAPLEPAEAPVAVESQEEPEEQETAAQAAPEAPQDAEQPPTSKKPEREKPKKAATARKPAPRQARPAPVAAALPTKGRQINVYITPEAYALAERDGRLYAEIAMDAIEWALDEGILGHLVEERTSRTRPAGGRFPGRRLARSRPEEGTSRVPWPTQFSPDQRAVLEEIKTEVGVRHLSALIGAAVEGYLTAEDDE